MMISPPNSLPLRDIVLIGGGHSHVEVLRAFGLRPLSGVRLTVICTDTDTPYSGMLPGYVAGHYHHDDVHIDLRRLAGWAGVRYFHDQVTGIDRAAQRVHCRQRPSVAYDLLSINIGSTPDQRGLHGAAEQVLPVKPVRGFNERWLALLERIGKGNGPATIAVVGAGAGGVELTLALQYRLRKTRLAHGTDPAAVRFHLFSADAEILVTHPPAVRRTFERVLRRRGVSVHRQSPIERVENGRLFTRTGETFAVDEVVWVTQAASAAWLRDCGLALDEQGFIRVHPALQSVSDPLIFAAGDCASLIDRPLAKAGVFAVRMGPPLAENLRRMILRQPLVAYHPQRHGLALISTGNRYAVASRGGWSARGRLLWYWKDWIDRRFMRKYSRFAEPSAPGHRGTSASMPTIPLANDERQSLLDMSTRGNGRRPIDPSIVARALARLQAQCADRSSIHSPIRPVADDATAIAYSPTLALAVSGIPAFIDDPWLFGRIVANHALAEQIAVEARAVPGAPTVSAALVVPPGVDRQVEETLFQVLAGALSVVEPAGHPLTVGTAEEGQKLALALAVDDRAERPMQSTVDRRMNAGEVLLLSKPLGSGALLAAHRQLRASGRWLDAALATMQQTNLAAVDCLRRYGASVCRAVGDDGLIGTLQALCQLSVLEVELVFNRLPLLEGAAESAAANRSTPPPTRLTAHLQHGEEVTAQAAYPLLFDADFAGALLAGVPATAADACLAELRKLGYGHAAAVGHCLPPSGAARPIRIILAG